MSAQHTRPTDTTRRQLLGAGLALAGSAALPALAADDKYPSRPITLVVPFPPGGSVDAMARMYTEPLGRLLGVPMVVENKPGAGGSIGAQFVARAKPDGYTLVVSSQSSHLANPLVQPNLGYDPIKDFENIAILGRQPNVLVTHPSIPVKNLDEFVAYLKANGGQINFGSAGAGSMGQLNVEAFLLAMNAKATHIPYRGGSPHVAAALSNEVQFVLDNLVVFLPHVQAGKLRALAVVSPTRVPQLPDVPTFAELGINGVDSVFFFGVVAPAGTPPDVVQRLNHAVHQALADPEVRQAFDSQSLDPSAGSPQQFGELLAQEVPRFRELVQQVGLKIE